MRKIKFRGRSLKDKAWYFGDMEYNPAANFARIRSYDEDGCDIGQHRVDPDTIGQFTGLCDKNGREIYEGDIVRLNVGAFQVCFNKDRCQFEFRRSLLDGGYIDKLWRENCDLYEVIGNIYDNSEITKTK